MLYGLWETYRKSSHLDDVETPKFSDAYKEVSPASAYQPQLHNQPVADQA
jgi:hypothetical protein